MGSCVGKIKNQKDKLKVQLDLNGTTYAETIQYIPPIRYGYVCKVYDGDTFTIASRMPGMDPNAKYRFSVRIKGIDCPELRTKNSEEKEIAIIARDYLETLINENKKIVELRNTSYDKYGRLCSEVYINNINISEKMINNRLAVAYDGGTKVLPISWKQYYRGL